MIAIALRGTNRMIQKSPMHPNPAHPPARTLKSRTPRVRLSKASTVAMPLAPSSHTTTSSSPSSADTGSPPRNESRSPSISTSAMWSVRRPPADTWTV